MKAQKKASERNTLPNIDWNNENIGTNNLCAVSEGTQVKIVLEATQSAGQWRESNASSVTFELLNKYWNPKTVTQLVTELQWASYSEDPEDDAQSDSSEMGDFIEHSYEVLLVPDAEIECVTVHSK